MSKKKIIYIVLLVIVVIAIIVGVVIVAGRTERLEVGNKNQNTSLGTRDAQDAESVDESDKKEATVETLSDGVLYSVSSEEMTPDIVIGDNYFDTQMADISLNFSKYEGKTVEIEGMALAEGPYTFVGRYSNSNICPNCPPGYAYFEYEWKGNQTPELVTEDSWLKVKGTFTRGDDNGKPYYYIDVASMEVMNEKGLTTVDN